MAAMNPSPTKPVVRFPTALLEDKELVTIHDSRLPDYKALEYGAPYPDQNKFPGLKLIFQEPLEDDRMVRRVWAGDRKDQDLYNADRKYSGGSTEHPILVRRYLFPEDGYEPLATGTPDSQFPEAVLVEEEVTQPENRNGYLAVTRVFETLPGPLLTGVQITEKGQIATITTQVVEPGTTVTPSALVIGGSVKPTSKGKSVLEQLAVPEVFGEKTFSKEVPDPVPEKFRVAIPAETTEETVEGQAASPTLGAGDLAKSEQQVTKFVKRKRATKRLQKKLPATLTQTATSPEKLKTIVKETLQKGDTTKPPSATVNVESEALGDGSYVVRSQDQVQVFSAPLFSQEAGDTVPAKFRVRMPTVTEERTEFGTATMPSVEGEEEAGTLLRSQQQVTKFTKRTRKVYRDLPAAPVRLEQTATTPEGLRAKVVETLQEEDSVEEPTALRSVESENLGDGKFVVRTTELPEVFDAKAFSSESPDPVPEKFRVSLAVVSSEKVEIGEASQPVLAIGDLSVSEQQVTKFTKKVRRVGRAVSDLPQTLSQTATTPEGIVAKINETLQEGDSTQTPSAFLSVESEALGGGVYVVRTTELPEVFNSAVHTSEIPDVVPQKFRAAIPTTSEELVLPGTAGEAVLGFGDLSASEQQVTKFTKKTRRVSRNIVDLPKQFTQTSTTPEGLKSTVTESLQVGDTSQTPSATTNVESEALGDGKYLVRTTRLPGIFEAKTFSVEKEETTPAKFLSGTSTTVEEKIEEGAAAAPSLNASDLSASEQQVTKFTKRVRRATREISDLPKTLTQTATTNQGLVATVTETLQVGDTTEQPTATVSLESEALGDGNYVVRKTELDEVFAGPVFSKGVTDPTPEKFRVLLQDTETEETVVGDAADPVIGPGELSVSEQQVTKFTKRIRKTSRPLTNLPVPLEQTATTPEGLKAKVTETLQSGDSTEEPTAKVSVASEALGNGNFVVRRTELPEVFSAKQVSVERGDVIPERFRSSIPTQTVEEIVEGDVESSIARDGALSLATDDLAKSEQQVTKFTKRVRTTKRSAPSISQGLSGVAYDEVLDISTPFTEKVVEHGSDYTVGAEVTPLSDKFALERRVDITEARSQLLSLYYTFPSQERVSLPDRLVRVKAIFAKGEGSSSGDGGGEVWQYRHGSETSITGDLIVEIEQGYAGLLPAINHVFYTPLDSGTLTDEIIYLRTNSKKWPYIETRSYNIVLVGSAHQKETSKSNNGESYSNSNSRSSKALVNSVYIPPTIHDELDIDSEIIAVGSGPSDFTGLEGRVTPKQLRKTKNTFFPTGRYLLTSSVTPYKYGMAKVTAVTVEVGSDITGSILGTLL